MNTTTLQQILGSGKEGSLFSVHTSIENPDDLHVYFGMAYLEKVKNSTDSFQYKYLLARLYNAGYKRRTLQETFGHAISTLRVWGNALLSGDIDIILSAFEGQGGKRKVTVEVENFIKSEYQKIYPCNKYTYSKEIISGVKEVFNVTVSSETVRKVLIAAKSIQENSSVAESPSSESDFKAKICDCSVKLNSNNTNNRNNSLSFSQSEEELERSYVHHLGIVFAFYLYKELNVQDKIIEQWLSMILLGKINLEQAESLNFDSLDLLHGYSLLRKAKSHHAVLRYMSQVQINIDNLFLLNARFVSGKNSSYIYYDPHSVKYTGMKNILKGWCGSAGKITKVNYQDFFHSSTGYPLYFEIHDNSIDMRERFIGSVENFTEKITDGIKKTFIIDRGIYGKEKMQKISDNGYGLVTWEKGCKKGAWDDNADIEHFEILRCKNHSGDAKTWKVKFFKDTSYSKIQGFYRLIVKIKPPKDKEECEVSILTNGKIEDKTAVFAMFNRWIQENDFRYMVINFGLNQITSYKSAKYDLTEELLAEKKVMSESYKLIRKSINEKENIFSGLLLKAAEKSKDNNIELSTEALRLKADLLKLKAEKKNMETYENKLNKMINDKTEKLLTNKKYMFDTVKIIARNIFYRLLEIFRPIYNNYRNDHTILRELLRADGYIYSQSNIIYISLDLKRRLNRKQRKSTDEFIKIIESNINNLSVFTKHIRLSLYKPNIAKKKRAFNLRFSKF